MYVSTVLSIYLTQKHMYAHCTCVFAYFFLIGKYHSHRLMEYVLLISLFFFFIRYVSTVLSIYLTQKHMYPRHTCVFACDHMVSHVNLLESK
jgi:hypothetical protein